MSQNAITFQNHYCHKCRQTHKHENKGINFQCQRCGTLSVISRNLRAMSDMSNKPVFSFVFKA